MGKVYYLSRKIDFPNFALTKLFQDGGRGE